MSLLRDANELLRRFRSDPSAQQPVHGRDARAPTAIPWRGWLEIATRTASAVRAHRATTAAAAITFYAMLAFIPALTGAAALYALLHPAEAVIPQALALDGIIPPDALALVEAEVRRVSRIPPQDLGWIAAIAFLATVGSVNAAIEALVAALNVANGEEECRPFFRRSLVVAAFTAALLVAAPAVFGALLIGRGLARDLNMAAPLVWLCRFAFLAAVASAGLAALYRYGPCREVAKWRWVTPGGLVAAITWLLTSAAVSLYLSWFARYQENYGILGAVLAVLGWLWLASGVIIVGAELNAQVERQTDRDTTA